MTPRCVRTGADRHRICSEQRCSEQILHPHRPAVRTHGRSCDRGSFALEELTDASPETARRTLADAGLSEARPPLAPVTEPAAARAEAERFLALLAVRAEPDAFDMRVPEVLRHRLELLDRHEHPAGPYGWVHGDCQDWNLIWTGRTIGAVIDWDRVCVRPYAEEIARAASWQFCLPDGRIEFGKVAALIAGYRTETPIDRAALADAARRRWKALSHCWQLVFHCDRTDVPANRHVRRSGTSADRPVANPM